MLDYGIRSKCCKAPVRMGIKKHKKTGEKIKVWVCCVCELKDVQIISKEEALQTKQTKEWWNDESDEGFSE